MKKPRVITGADASKTCTHDVALPKVCAAAWREGRADVLAAATGARPSPPTRPALLQ